MKKHVLMVIAMLSVLISLAVAAEEVPTKKLVKNGGFESGKTGWRILKYKHPEWVSAKLATDAPHSGKNCVELSITNKEGQIAAYQTIAPVKPNTKYRLTVWAKRKGLSAKPIFFNLQERDVAWSKKLPNHGVSKEFPEGQWVLAIDITFTTNAETGLLEFYPILNKDVGTLWVDDVSLVEVK